MGTASWEDIGGMAVIVAKDEADKALNAFRESNVDAYVMGEIVKGEERIILC